MIEYEKEFELYHYEESLCSQMVRIALEEKRLDWKSHTVMLEEVAFTGQNLTPEYLRVNPKGRVPTLVHNGAPVYDSYEIIGYLDKQRPDSGERLVPDDGDLKARIEEWVLSSSLRDDVEFGKSLGTAIPILSGPVIARMLKWQPSEHVARKFERHPVPARARAYTGLRAAPLSKVDSVPEFALDTMASSLVRIERALDENGDFVLGPFTQVDVMMMAHFHRLEDLALGGILKDPNLPDIAAYWQRLQARPSYRTAVTDWHEDHWRRGMQETFHGQPSKHLTTLKQKVAQALS